MTLGISPTKRVTVRVAASIAVTMAEALTTSVIDAFPAVLVSKLVAAGGTYWVGDKKYWDARVDAYDAAADRWQPLAPLPQPWGDAPAVVVGEVFYILGGGTDGVAQSTVQCYQRGTWSAVSHMALPAPRER